MISSIVPVYNNEKTVTGVIKALLSCPEIGEVIVVDDGSEDGSVKKIKTFGGQIKTIFNRRNLGKGAAVVKGVRISQGETLLLCDADLTKIKKDHLASLINEYCQGGWGMVIAARESREGWFHAKMARVAGERIFAKKAIEPCLDLIAKSGSGIEQLINFCHRRQRVKIIVSKDIGHILKYQRGDPKKALKDYLQEASQLFKTQLVIQKMSTEQNPVIQRLREKIKNHV